MWGSGLAGRRFPAGSASERVADVAVLGELERRAGLRRRGSRCRATCTRDCWAAYAASAGISLRQRSTRPAQKFTIIGPRSPATSTRDRRRGRAG